MIQNVGNERQEIVNFMLGYGEVRGREGGRELYINRYDVNRQTWAVWLGLRMWQVTGMWAAQDNVMNGTERKTAQ